QSAESLGFDGSESFSIKLVDNLQARQGIKVVARKTDGTIVEFDTLCRIDTPVEVDYYRNGGILQTVLRKRLSTEK
ncbi:MAG: hypothetical protein WED82_14630, partial [Balneolales bacterium]